jgi:arylformamidase
MTIFDVTRPLSPGTLVYPGDIVPAFRAEDHGAYIIAGLTLSTHSGTHIDAPSHYLRNDATVDRIPAGHLLGKCSVADLSGVAGEIMPEHLGDIPPGTRRVLFRTSFSGRFAFSPDYPSLSPAAAVVLAGSGILCVGIDSPSIERFGGDGSVHRTLLGAGVAIIELLDLIRVPAGEYDMVALPLRLEGLDGSPARVLLSDEGWPRG